MGKEKKCKCGKVFQQFNSTQSRCIECAIAKGRYDTAKKIEREKSKAIKEFNKETSRRKEALKTTRDYIKPTQVVVNRYIRLRDQYEACISCGAKAGTYIVNAGHYFSAGGHNEMRFEPSNIHAQCDACNDGNRLSGNIHNYRLGLIERYGQKYFDDLCELKASKDLRKKSYTKEILADIRSEFKDKIKALQDNQ